MSSDSNLPAELRDAPTVGNQNAGLPPELHDAPVVQRPPLKQAQHSVTDFLNKEIGKPLVWGVQHPLSAFMSVFGAPDRALRAGELGRNPAADFMSPKSEDEQYKQLRAPITPSNPNNLPGALGGMRDIGAWIGDRERGVLAGDDLPSKFARGVLDTAYDSANSLWPAFQPAKIPKAAKLGGKLAEMAESTPIGQFLSGEAGLQGWTEHGRAIIESVVNKHRQDEWAEVQNVQKVIAANADAIRNGRMPQAVRNLARHIPQAYKGMSPQEVEAAIVKQIRDRTWAKIRAQFSAMGFAATKRMRVTLRQPQLFIKDPAKMKEALDGLQEFLSLGKKTKLKLTGNWLYDTLMRSGNFANAIGRAATHRGNQAFLSIPLAHDFNLANLAHNEYGVAAVLNGLQRAIRISTGIWVKGTQLEKDVQELEKIFAHSQYRHIWNEYGMSKILGIPKTEPIAKVLNKVAIIPAERFSNWMQDKLLNPVETGLRSVALGEEAKRGKTGAEAARNIHGVFGTNPANKAVKDIAESGQPFAQFHFQTSIGSTVRALVKYPDRIIRQVKAVRDMNNQVNPHGPYYIPSVPALSGAKALSDINYWASAAGPLYQLGKEYSSLSLAEKGKVAQALSKAFGRYIPAGQVVEVISNLLTGNKGRSGESVWSDVAPIGAGGSYTKLKP